MFKNKKGQTGAELVPVILVLSIILVQFGRTVENGTAKKNGQKIWCKMQNKGADYCDNKYQ